MCTQGQVTSSKRWTWFTKASVRGELRQEGDNSHYQTEQNQSEDDGAADFILFRVCVMSVVVGSVMCHAAKIADSCTFNVHEACNPLGAVDVRL